MTRVGAVVLAAGRSRRMGDANKLLLPVEGVPLVARSVDAVLGSRARPVLVVTGHEAECVRTALADRPVRFVHNPEFAAGQSSSLRVGIEALGGALDGALVCLADMPWVRSADLDRLIEAFAASGGRAICVPQFEGRRGNPVLWPAAWFEAVAASAGDAGARGLLEAHADALCHVAVSHAGVTRDVDTPAALAAGPGRRRT